MEAEEFLEVCSNREGSCLISIDQLAEVQLLGYMAAGGCVGAALKGQCRVFKYMWSDWCLDSMSSEFTNMGNLLIL